MDALLYILFSVVFVLGCALWVRSKAPRNRTIPGPRPSSKRDGNFGDIVAAGSLHAYLAKLHCEHGPIVAFWWGSRYVVSVCSAALFKEQARLFDRPEFLFEFFSPLITNYSIQLTNGSEGRRRRFRYDLDFSHEACDGYVDRLLQIGQKNADKVEHECVVKAAPMELSALMLDFAIRSICCCCYGGAEDDEVADLVCVYDEAIDGLARLWGGPGSPKNQDGDRGVLEKVRRMRAVIEKIVKRRMAVHSAASRQDVGAADGGGRAAGSPDDYLFLDRVIDVVSESETFSEDVKQEVILGDAITFFIAGFHTTAFMLTWCLYYLAKNKSVQDRVHEELASVLGRDPESAPLRPEQMPDLVYCKAVLDESLRCGKVGILAARYSSQETALGGYTVPAGVPVIHELAVSFDDPVHFPQPEKFDPDRFLPDASKNRPNLAFVPFGFAGKRKCPGYRFSYVESLVLMSVVCRKYELRLADPSFEARHSFGISTRPDKEVMVVFEPRETRDSK